MLAARALKGDHHLVLTAVTGTGVRLVPLGMVAGLVMGAGVGARSLVDDVAGLWAYGLIFGAGAGAVLGGVVGGLSTAIVTPRVIAASAKRPGTAAVVSLWWQVLVPVPAASGLAWWVMQSPSVGVADRVVLTAAVAATCAALVMLTSRWVLTPTCPAIHLDL